MKSIFKSGPDGPVILRLHKNHSKAEVRRSSGHGVGNVKTVRSPEDSDWQADPFEHMFVLNIAEKATRRI